MGDGADGDSVVDHVIGVVVCDAFCRMEPMAVSKEQQVKELGPSTLTLATRGRLVLNRESPNGHGACGLDLHRGFLTERTRHQDHLVNSTIALAITRSAE